MDKNIFIPGRKNYIELGDIYFWTARINNWQRLLETEDYKKIIINSLSYVSDTGKIDEYAFVIMPNHIHLIWRVKELNGKETAKVFFLKYTAHEFKKQLIKEGYGLSNYLVNASNKKYEFWQREMTRPKKSLQVNSLILLWVYRMIFISTFKSNWFFIIIFP